MKRTVLTGGTGFVGANLCRRLLADGHEVHLLVRPTHMTWRISDIVDQIRLHEVELADADGLTRTITSIKPEWVFHLAVYGAYSAQSDARRMVDTNVLGTLNLLLACVPGGFEAFVNTGSSSEYGFQDHPPAETETPRPNSYYAVTKASTTLLCQYVAREHGLHVPTLRLYSVYGPFEEPSRLVPSLIVRGLGGGYPPLAAPDTARDYVYVDDVCEAYLLAAGRRAPEAGPVYNVGTGVQTTLEDIVALAQRELGIPGEPTWASMPDRRWDTSVWVADPRKIREELGWRPAYDLAQGFRRTVAWLRDHPLARSIYW